MELIYSILGTLMGLMASTGIRGGSPPSPDTPAEINTIALVGEDGASFCSGSLIADDIVLTAAHCLERIQAEGPEGERFFVYFGRKATAHASEDEAQDRIAFTRPIEDWRIYHHPLIPTLQGITSVRDLAWVRFSGGLPQRAPGEKPFEALPLLDVSSTELRQLKDQFERYVIAGFGHTGDGLNNQLKQADVEISQIHITQSQNYGRRLDAGLSIVSPGNQSSAACHGDSGGPIYGLIDRQDGKGPEWYILGALSTGASRTDDEDMSFRCRDSYHSEYTYVGLDSSWLLEDPLTPTTQRKVPTLLEHQATIPRPITNRLRDWCLYNNSLDPAWMTTTYLMSHFLIQLTQARRDLIVNFSCYKIEEFLSRDTFPGLTDKRLSLSLLNLIIEAHQTPTYPVVSYLSIMSAPQTGYVSMDLEPLVALGSLDSISELDLQSVVLEAEDISNFLPHLKDLSLRSTPFLSDGDALRHLVRELSLESLRITSDHRYHWSEESIEIFLEYAKDRDVSLEIID